MHKLWAMEEHQNLLTIVANYLFQTNAKSHRTRQVHVGDMKQMI